MVSKKPMNRVDPTQLAGRREVLSGHWTTVGIRNSGIGPQRTLVAAEAVITKTALHAPRTPTFQPWATSHLVVPTVGARGARGLAAQMCADRS
jgi:hypothetical protein